jgi:DHA1 family tetracycline resistance protein-like MFS transporter
VSSTGTGRNQLIFIFVTRLIDAIGFGIVMPVLPQLLLHLGEPNVAAAARIAGELLVTYAILQFFFGPVIGNLSDRFGRRPVILASLAAFALDFTVMGFAPRVSWLFIGRAIAGMAGAVYIPANAYVADVTPPEQRARAFGLIGSAFGIGFVLGPAAGGLLGEIGPRAPFFAAAALAGVNFLFGLFVLPESLPPERRRGFDWTRANPLGAALQLRKHPVVLGYALAVTAYLIGNNVYPSTWAFFMTAKFGWSPGLIGLSLVVSGLGMAFAQALLVGRIVRRIHETGSAFLGLSVSIVGYFAYALAPQGWMVFAISPVVALQAITYPALNALMTRHIPRDSQGELQGAVASLSSVANIFGPLLLTQSLAYFTAPGAPIYFPGAAFVVAACITALGIVILAVQTARMAPDKPDVQEA